MRSSMSHFAASCIRHGKAVLESGIMNGGKHTIVDDVAPKPKRVKPAVFQLRHLKNPEETYRTNDEIHVTILFCPVMKALIDTPHFQRLRRLKQLGTAYYVYMNANHSRLEHSMGVACLAEKMCCRLMDWQPSLGITAKDVLCVKLAGLLHDIGHGPYSHVFEGVPTEIENHLDRNPHLRDLYNGCPTAPASWKHEDASLMMIDDALKELGLAIDMTKLDEPLRQIGDGVAATSMRVFDRSENDDPKLIMTSRDWVFIKEMILGQSLFPVDSHLKDHESGFIGRPERRSEFLYDIISNRFSGLDVDKMDYYARDARRTLWKGAIEVRLIDEAVVAWADCPMGNCAQCKHRASYDDRHLMICYPEKMREPAADFFRERFLLHSKVYSHKTVEGASYMIRDILVKADPFFRLRTTRESAPEAASLKASASETRSRTFPISRAMENPRAYLMLDDGVLDAIYATDTPELRDARELIERFRSRDLYKLAASRAVDAGNDKWNGLWERCKRNEFEFKTAILAVGGKHKGADGTITLDEQDFIVYALNNHHGKKNLDPTHFMRFLPKDEMHKLTRTVDQLPAAKAIEDDGYMTRVLEKRFIRVFCRNEEKLDLLRHVFTQWEAAMDMELEMTGFHESDDEPDTVPLTQESLTFLSPERPRTDGLDQDPSPVPTIIKTRPYMGFR